MTLPNPHAGILEAEVGGTVTDGFEVLLLTGDEPAVIESVRSIGGENAMRFLGAKLAGPQRRGTFQQLSGWPPTKPALGELIDAEDAEVLPREQTPDNVGYELLLGYEVLDAGELASRSEVEVVYRVGDERFRWLAEAALVVCPDDRSTSSCLDEATA